MDQIKIGKFIAELRKEQNMTQSDLAEKLNISNRAVSKWETGKSLPDPGIMQELCSYLKINVNELLAGERISAEEYRTKAEENLLALSRQRSKRNGGYGITTRPVILDEEGVRVKDITLKEVKNPDKSAETTQNLMQQIQMKQISDKLDSIAELQGYQIDQARNAAIKVPFLNARDYIFKAQETEMEDKRKEYSVYIQNQIENKDIILISVEDVKDEQ